MPTFPKNPLKLYLKYSNNINSLNIFFFSEFYFIQICNKNEEEMPYLLQINI
jgi:hypothetical protein